MRRLFMVMAALVMAAINAGAANEGFLKGKILKLDKESIAERGESSMSLSLSGISTSSSITLLDVERALDKAVEDDKIAMVYINYDHFSSNMSNLEEIRHYLGKIRAAGKPVIAWGASLSNGSYYLASVADRVFLHPAGGGSLTGIGSTQFFLKDMLDTLGVGVQLIRHGKFKSAGEMYIRNDISPENRLQYEEMMGSMWATVTEAIAISRGKTPDEINSIADNLKTGTAKTWLDLGLVDGLKYRDEMEKYLCHLFGTTEPGDVKTVSLKKYISDLDKGPSSRKVAVIYADGEIVRSGSGIAGEKLAAVIAKVRADSTVKTVVFRVNSPGGEVVAADMIRREIELLMKDKPVVASYGAYAASGGYLISAGCEKIYTDNLTLTGSIGVFGMVPNLGNAIRKNLKINPVTIGTNAHSGMGSGMEPLSPEEEAWYQEEIEGIYSDFVGVVSKGRNMTTEAVDEIAQGRVWTGRDALRIGLADEVAPLYDVVVKAAESAGLKSFRIETYPVKKKQSLRSFASGGDGNDKDNPLVIIKKQVTEPGFKAMARMPYFTID